jgi:hypothetical protein
LDQTGHRRLPLGTTRLWSHDRLAVEGVHKVCPARDHWFPRRPYGDVLSCLPAVVVRSRVRGHHLREAVQFSSECATDVGFVHSDAGCQPFDDVAARPCVDGG